MLTNLDSMFSLPVLEHQLIMYITSDGKDSFVSPFDLSKVPIVTREQADADERTRKLTSATPTLKAPSSGPKKTPLAAEAATSAAAAAQKYATELQKIPELAAYGGVLKSSPVIELTESETEYVVKAIKHVFKEHIVLQFVNIHTLMNICPTLTSFPGHHKYSSRHSPSGSFHIIYRPRSRRRR